MKVKLGCINTILKISYKINCSQRKALEAKVTTANYIFYLYFGEEWLYGLEGDNLGEVGEYASEGLYFAEGL